MAQPATVNVLEHSRVALPKGFIPQTPLPLTHFDLPWLVLSFHVKRLFFYSYSHTNTHFMNTTLPDIKHSLSLTLKHFYPLAGTLAWPPQSPKPFIHCSEQDSVSLTVMESNLSFNNLIGNHPRDVNEFHSLVAALSFGNMRVDQVPVMALQVTLFPNKGICIGISVHHVIADGKAISHFMKSWALVCRTGSGDASCLLPESLPSYDRNVINDPNNLELAYLNDVKTMDTTSIQNLLGPCSPTNKVISTFAIGRPQIQKMKGFVLEALEKYKDMMIIPPPLHISSFVVICSYVWVCLTKVLAREDVDEIEREYFFFIAECRERLNPPIPATYFGNCLLLCAVDMKQDDLMGEDGIAIAAAAMANAIQSNKEEALRGPENYFTKLKPVILKPQRCLSTAGSPKLGFYGTDFGWGTPKKVEVVSIENSSAMSISESGDGEGGIEVGLVLDKLQMDVFASLFTDGLDIW